MKEIFKSKKIKIFLVLISLFVFDFFNIYLSIDLSHYQNIYPKRANSGKIIWEKNRPDNYARLSEISDPVI